MPPKKRPVIPADIQVIIPYRDLVELLGAAYEVGALRDDMKLVRAQLAALRSQFTELMELYREYQD